MNNTVSSSSSTNTQYPYRSTDPIVAPSQSIRGVNIGGWLVLERYITPSVFAITKCHLDGNPCWYPTSSVVLNQNKNSTTNTNTETSNGIEDSFLETLEATLFFTLHGPSGSYRQHLQCNGLSIG